MKSRSLVSANITCSRSIVFLSLTLVTRKHRYLPGTCATDGGSAAIPPSPGLCLNRNSTFWFSLLKSAFSLDLKLMSAVIQIALVLSDRMKSLSVIRIFSEYSFGISNFAFLKFRPMVGSASSPSSSSPHFSLTSLSFFIVKFSVWVSPTPTPRTKIIIDVPVNYAGSELSGGMSSGPSVAVQPKRRFSVFMCFPADMSTCCMLCPSSLPFLTSRIHSNILRFVFSLLSISLCSKSVSRSGVE